jgi:hypothetical protein
VTTRSTSGAVDTPADISAGAAGSPVATPGGSRKSTRLAGKRAAAATESQQEASTGPGDTERGDRGAGSKRSRGLRLG